MRRESNYDYYDPVSEPETQTAQPVTYDTGGDGDYFSDPYVSPYSPSPPYGRDLTTGTEYQGVSRVGPSVSRQPVMGLPVGLPAGSLFGGRYFGSGSAYRGRASYARSFSVELQEKLRRRRKGRWFG